MELAMPEKQQTLLQVAREYCQLIEQTDSGEQQIFTALIKLLPRLHAAIVAYADEQEVDCNVPEADLDARFELFSRLKQMLGDRDGYWLEFDVVSDEQCKSGSLADDLTDIYCELKAGLNALEENARPTDQTIENWRCGYKVHWGKHLIDAEKHLFELRSSNRL